MTRSAAGLLFCLFVCMEGPLSSQTSSNGVPVLRPPTRKPDAASHGTGQRGVWDLAIALGGLVYLGIALFTDWTSPLFGMTLIVLAGYQLFAHHSGERQEHH